MDAVTIRVPATTANLGPGFDCFGCALNLYTDVTFECMESGLEISGCDEAYAGPENLVYQAYVATIRAMDARIKGIKIHIDSHIPISRGLGSSAALLVAGAMGANFLHGSPLTKEDILTITNRIEGHPDNLSPAIYGGLTASIVEEGKPISVSFPVHADWIFLAMIPDFTLSTDRARQALPESYSKFDTVFNISHSAMVLKALENGDEALLRLALDDRIHQPYRKCLIYDFEAIEALISELGGAFCISGAGPTLLCITRKEALQQQLEERLPEVTDANWKILPLQVQNEGARVLSLAEKG